MKTSWAGLMMVVLAALIHIANINSAYYDTITEIALYETAKVNIPKYIFLERQTVYGYSSTVDQTDSDPYTTASGNRVYSGLIANNCLPYKSKVVLLGVGSKHRTFTVDDRMNSRYGCDIWDIWFPTREEALRWGRRTITIRIKAN